MNLPLHTTGQNETILVVEDEEALCQLLKRMLTNLGYQVKICTDAQKALELLRKGKLPDLLITDIVMPNMNGKELADQVLELYPEQKILFMSGFADDVIAKHGILSEHAPLIQKPFTAKDIGAVIRKVLSTDKPPLRILLLDDEAGIRHLLQRSCTKRGFICQGVEHTENAIAELKQEQYDLLLVDMNLGELNGAEAIRRIREAGFDLPVIVLSGLIQKGLLEELKPLGVINTIEKSFDNNPLLDYISQFFHNR